MYNPNNIKNTHTEICLSSTFWNTIFFPRKFFIYFFFVFVRVRGNTFWCPGESRNRLEQECDVAKGFYFFSNATDKVRLCDLRVVFTQLFRVRSGLLVLIFFFKMLTACVKFKRVQLRFMFLDDCKRKPGDFENCRTH